MAKRKWRESLFKRDSDGKFARKSGGGRRRKSPSPAKQAGVPRVRRALMKASVRYAGGRANKLKAAGRLHPEDDKRLKAYEDFVGIKRKKTTKRQRAAGQRLRTRVKAAQKRSQGRSPIEAGQSWEEFTGGRKKRR